MGTPARGGTVLVGVDGSPASAGALQWGAECAVRRGHRLHLVHAFAWPAYAASYGLPPGAWPDEGVRMQAEALLGDAAARAHQLAPSVAVHGEVLRGTPAAVLSEASRHATVAVVGDRGAGGFSGLLLGSVSTQLTRHGHGVVVVVPRDGDPPDGARPRVVVGTDSSPGAEPALRFAFEEAASRHATVTIVRAWQTPPPSWRDELLPTGDGRAELESAEAQRLASDAQPWQEKYPDVPVEHQLVAEHPARALAAAGHGAQLLVIGACGHSGFRGPHLGSVGVQLLHDLPCPIAVVRPAHHELED